MGNFLADFGAAVPAIAQMQHQAAIEKGMEQEAVLRNMQIKKAQDEEKFMSEPIPLEMVQQKFANSPVAGKAFMDSLNAQPGIISNVNGKQFVRRKDLMRIGDSLKQDHELQSAVIQNHYDTSLQGAISASQALAEAQQSGDPKKIEKAMQDSQRASAQLKQFTQMMHMPELMKAQATAQSKGTWMSGPDGQMLNIPNIPGMRAPEGFAPPSMYVKEGSDTGKPSYRDSLAVKAAQGDTKAKSELDAILSAEGQKVRETTTQRTEASQASRNKTITPEAVDYMARSYIQTGKMPPMGLGGTEARIAIITRAAELAKQSGDTPEGVGEKQAAFQALSSGLKQLESRKAQILSFANTTEANLKIVEELSDKVGRTGIPVVNKWLLAGKKSVAGDVDVAKFDAAMRTAVNEYAKVTSSATGGGVTSDQARKDIEDIVSTAQTPEQVKGVIDLLRKEMNNRREGFSREEQALREGLSKSNVNSPGTGGAQQTQKTGASEMPIGTVKTINGIKYKKVKGGWQQIQ